MIFNLKAINKQMKNVSFFIINTKCQQSQYLLSQKLAKNSINVDNKFPNFLILQHILIICRVAAVVFWMRPEMASLSTKKYTKYFFFNGMVMNFLHIIPKVSCLKNINELHIQHKTSMLSHMNATFFVLYHFFPLIYE